MNQSLIGKDAEAEILKIEEAVRLLILEGRKRFLTEPEAALYLGRSQRWVRLMRQRRILPFSKVGGAVRYETARIDEALRALERPSALAPKGGRK